MRLPLRSTSFTTSSAGSDRVPSPMTTHNSRRTRGLRVLAGALLLLAGGCSGVVDNPRTVSVSVDPAQAEVAPGETRRFEARVEGASDPGVTWSATGGTLAVEGSAVEWTAPEAAGEYTLTAASVAEPARSGSAVVRVVQPQGAVVASFAGYRGTAASLPAGFFVAGENGKGVKVSDGYDPFTGVSRIGASSPDAFDGFGAFTADGVTHSFGIRERGGADLREARLFLRYTNTSGRAVAAFEVEYDVEVWRLGERANRIRLKFSTDTTGFGALPDLVSTADPRGSAAAAAVGTVVDGTRPENRVRVRTRIDLADLPGPGDATIGSLAPGATGYFRWQYSNAEGDAGTVRSALALNNVRIVPVFTDTPAPGTSTAPLSFSHPPGFHAEPFQLALGTALKNATIYYTIDGSDPDPSRVVTDAAWAAMPAATRRRTFVYRDPVDVAALTRRANDVSLIPTNAGFALDGYPPGWTPPAGEVEKAAVIRAAVVTDGRVEARETRTYFVAPRGRGRYTLPVVSLSADRGSLFSADSGIYVPGDGAERNYNRRGAEWERRAHFELFDLDGRRPLAQEVGVRIHGGGTRNLPQKTLRLYARSEYGKGRLRYRFFPTKAVDDFDRILLRNAGNDWWAGLLRDPVLQTLVQHLPFETQHYQPGVVFVNGEYWGLHNFRDRLDAQHLATHHGIPPEQVVVQENNGALVEGAPGADAPFHDFMARVRRGELKSRPDFERYVDVDGYLDYLITQMYAANTDWPQNNVLFWRYAGPSPAAAPGPRDGRWRWMLFDVDRSLGFHTTKATDMVRYVFVEDHPAWMAPSFELPRALMAVPEVRAELQQRAAVHLATTFRETRVRAQIESAAARIAPEVGEHVARWRWPRSEAEWRHHVGVMQDFAADRPGLMRGHFVGAFGEVTGTALLEISNLGGGREVSLHTVKIAPGAPGVTLQGGRWTGRLFTGIPVVVRSAGVDLSRAEVTGGHRDLVRAAGELRFVLTGDARVALP